MYNGIGLQTPRGSGTNGYVQRNMCFVPKSREKVNYKTEEDIRKLDALVNKKPNQGILAHERKRVIELKCLEMQELMEEQGYPEAEIESKVSLFRKMLMEKEGIGEREIPKDEFGRPAVKESHQIAEANQEKNQKMRQALGISEHFVEGSSLDPERRAREAAAAAAAAEEAKKKYAIIPDSSSSSSPERSHEKQKEKKVKKKRSHSSREKVESSTPSKKKKNSKKHKKERSVSLEIRKKKKLKQTIKEKPKHRSKYEESHKKHARSSSSSTSSSSDDDDDEDSNSGSSSRNSNSDAGRKHKSSLKHVKSHKGHRKRSSSSESIRYSKDSRSRKDIYEAKKGKHKRKSTRSSSSSSEQIYSPKALYRLEPILVNSKSKHLKARHFIEVPAKSAFDLKKFDKKKRLYESSSSSSDEKSNKYERKRRKHSSTPPPSASKHHLSRMDGEKSHKRGDSVKSAKKHEKESKHSSPEAQRKKRSRSRSGGSQHKSHHKNKALLVEDISYTSKKKKEKRAKNSEEKCYDKGSRDKRKHNRNESVSPKRHNGFYKKGAKSSSESEDSNKSDSSPSPDKRKKYLSPSCSPPSYKPKKHILADSSPMTHNSQKQRNSLKSPVHSPKKLSSKTKRSCMSPLQSPSHKKHYKKHDYHSESISPTPAAETENPAYLKDKLGKKSSRVIISPSRENSKSQSPSRITKSKSRHKVVRDEPYNPDEDREAVGSKKDGLHHIKGRKYEDEIRGLSKSSNCDKKGNSKTKNNVQKCNVTVASKSASPDGRTLSSPVHINKKVPSEDSPNYHIQDSDMKSPSQLLRGNDQKRKEKNNSTKQSELILKNKKNPVLSEGKNLGQQKEKFNSPDRKLVSEHSKDFSEESRLKNGPDSFHENPTVTGRNFNADKVSDVKKSRPNETVDDNFQSSYSVESPGFKSCPKEKNGDKSIEVKEGDKCCKKEDIECSDRKRKRNESPTPAHNADDYLEMKIIPLKENNRKNKGKRPSKLSRSRSRSRSLPLSPSASERSSRSRSRSYSKSRSKSYSKSRSISRSKSYTKSHSKSCSRSHSKSCSKSYSRSRSRSRSLSVSSRSTSRSYSSRSRSRSIARSPSIPRRRGSPSFLDKRRITS